MNHQLTEPKKTQQKKADKAAECKTCNYSNNYYQDQVCR